MNPIEIVIGEPCKDSWCAGECGDCQLKNIDGEEGHSCNVDLAVVVDAGLGSIKPGPRCVPGRYVLVPAARWEAAVDLCRYMLELIREHDNSTVYLSHEDEYSGKLARAALGEEKHEPD